MAIAFDYGSVVGSYAGTGRVSHIAVTADVDMPVGSRKVSLSKLDVAVADIRVRGTAAVDDLDKMAVSFDLTADTARPGPVDGIDEQRGAGDGTSDRRARSRSFGEKSPTELPIAALRKLDAHGTLRIQSVTVEHLVLTGRYAAAGGAGRACSPGPDPGRAVRRQLGQ